MTARSPTSDEPLGPPWTERFVYACHRPSPLDEQWSKAGGPTSAPIRKGSALDLLLDVLSGVSLMTVNSAARLTLRRNPQVSIPYLT